MQSLPYKNLKTSKDSVICQKCWSASFNTVSKKEKLMHLVSFSRFGLMFPKLSPKSIPTLTPDQEIFIHNPWNATWWMDYFTQMDNVSLVI